jgi:hypothetical protein
MALRKMFDAAYPAKVLAYGVPNWAACAFYIGGNTPHIATDVEWAKFSQRYRLPIFTRSTGGDPVADAKFSVAWLQKHNVPKGVTLALDFENRVDGTYLKTFDAVVKAAGYLTMVYGQLSTILDNPKPSGGYWIAHWTGVAHMEPGAAATQWSGSGPFGGAYDPNLVADSTPLWDTGEDMALTDTDKKWLLDNIKQEVTNTYRLADHGDADKTYDPTPRSELKTALDDLAAKQAELDAKLDALAAQGVVIDPGAIARATVDDLVNRVSFKAA